MNRLKHLLYILLIIGIALYLTSPLLRGEYIHPLGEYEIYKSFMVNFIDTLKHGELPVWNEYVGGGHPAMYFGHYPITQNTFFYMLFGVKDFTYYFVRFLSLIILLASFVYAGRLLKFSYLTSLIGALVYFSIGFVSRLFLYETIGNLLIYPVLLALIFQIIKEKQLKAILIFNLVYIFWLSGGLITYVIIQLIMLSVIYWISVFVIAAKPLKAINLKRHISLYLILFVIPILAVLYQYYFIYDVIRASNRLKEGLIVSPFLSVVWEQLWRSLQCSSYFWVGLILIPLSFIRKSIKMPKIMTMVFSGLLLFSVITNVQIISTNIFFVDYIPFLNSSDFRIALLFYIMLSRFAYRGNSNAVTYIGISNIAVFIAYISLVSYYFYSPENTAKMEYDLFMELSIFSRCLFILCLFFAMKSFDKNKVIRILIISLIFIYLIRSHLTIPLMRFAGIPWYPTRDVVAVSSMFAFLFLFGLKDFVAYLSDILKRKIFANINGKSLRYFILLTLLAVLAQDSYHKFYDGQCNKVVFPNRMNLANTEREEKVLNNRKEIPFLNNQLLDLDKRTNYFYRIFTPEPVFTYLAGDLQSHKIHDAAIYESSMSKDYRDFFDYVILKKPLLDSKEIKNVLPHAVFTKHIYPGLNISQGQIPYNDVFLFSAVDAPYLKNQNIEFFWDIMQVKYLVVGSAFSKALEEFSDKENYKLLGSYPSLDLNLYEITKNRKFSRLGILPVKNGDDLKEMEKKLNSGDADILKGVYARVIYLDKSTKDFTLLKSQAEQSRRYYELDAKQKGILIEFESWNRHWKLEVNGEGENIYRAFKIFRGIKIEPGKNVIELRYNVPYFKELFWLSVVVSLLYIFLLLTFMSKNRKISF